MVLGAIVIWHGRAFDAGIEPMPLFLASLIACASPVAIDGDTLRCASGEHVRLLSIDAPEMPGHCRRGRRCTPGDPFASQRSLARLIERGRVTCSPAGRDAYGRVLARCQAGGVDLSCAQVAGGFAVVRYGSLSCRRR